MNNDGAHLTTILLSKSEGAENLYTVPIGNKYDARAVKLGNWILNNSSYGLRFYLAYT